ncbi:hypothetical protein [Pseudomonas sp. BF-R-19]|uniref:hypothetical protein n=1 Tax=Pseudomonas sp. BF-R-19 TaxID=2832397 RepID=UPI001CC193C6|nr:hypothetical protein [Pseudomonas sp. BF-R-19]
MGINKRRALQMGRLVLEAESGFQYMTPSYRAIYNQLQSIVQSRIKGAITMITGEPGCGISTLLSHVVKCHSAQVLLLSGNVFVGETNIVDHICEDFHLEGTRKAGVIPAYLPIFASATGRQTLVIDDLDIYIERERDLTEVFEFFQVIGKGAHALSVIFSTRNTRLVRNFHKHCLTNWQVYNLADNLDFNDLNSMAIREWGVCNQQVNMKIPTPSNWGQTVVDCGMRLHLVQTALRICYVENLLGSAGVIVPDRDKWALKDYELELLQICYS